MANICTYNGVSINNIDLRDVQSEAVYDEGDQSVSHNKSTITVVGTLDINIDGTLSTNINNVRQKLLRPRANLQISIGGGDIFNITAPDDLGGPKPRRCEINNIIGSNFCHVVWTVEVNMTECPLGTPSNVVSHRYMVTHELDEHFYTVRTLRGVIRVRDTLTNNPDALRSLVTPAIPQGFKRVRAAFAVPMDGLRLEYDITDKEVYKTAPKPCTSAKGTFAHHAPNGFIWFNRLDFELEGAKTSNRSEMFDVALTILGSRMDFTKELLRSATVQEDLYENRLRFSFLTQVTDNTGKAFAWPANTPMLKSIANPDEGTSVDLGPYGSAMIAAAKQAFYLPCTDSPEPADEISKTGDSTGTSISTTLAPNGEPPTGTGDKLSGAQLSHPYTFYQDHLSYDQYNGVVVLPSTKALTPGRAYQLHNPYMILVQDGAAERDDTFAFAPQPYWLETGNVVMEHKIRHRCVQGAADKTRARYRTEWHYKIAVPFTGGNFFAFKQTGNYVDGVATTGMLLPDNVSLNGFTALKMADVYGITSESEGGNPIPVPISM